MRKKIEKLNPYILRVVKSAFPEFRGRKLYYDVTESIDVRSFWDGGSRSYFVFVELATMNTIVVHSQHPAFDRPIPDASDVQLPHGVVCVEHSIFCGRDAGVTIHCLPDAECYFEAVVPKELLHAEERAGNNLSTALRKTV